MQSPPTPAARRITWSPGRRLRIVLLATSAGSVLGLVFGLSSLNRPILNAAVFYVVGALLAAVLTGLAVLLVHWRHRSEPVPAGRRAERAPRRASDG